MARFPHLTTPLCAAKRLDFRKMPPTVCEVAEGPPVTTITIPISAERLAELTTRAEQAGLAPDEFLRREVDQLLVPRTERFRQAADYVLQKNAELYRRLA